MCGIAGIFAYAASAPADIGELRRIRDHMTARGPDDHGEWLSEDQHTALGHRRLSIIDLSHHSAQPMVSADGRYVIVFNGEIYNYRALRADLEARGRQFHTESDTEVLLQLFAERGAGMLDQLRGMFAFGIWDNQARRLFLARDPYGIKPLYYGDDGHTFRFASQVKALLAGGGIAREVEPAGLAGFFVFGSVPEPWTIQRGIRALPAGHYLWVSEKGAEAPVQYFSIAAAWADAEAQASSVQKDQAAIREALLDSVRHHLVADVQVGAFLSAGMDSGALVGLMRDAGQQEIQTVTLAFQEFHGSEHDESPLAAEVARHYGVAHTIRRVTEGEFLDDLPKILQAMDQPSIDGINTWFVSKAARELGLKVAISGLGGDELFGGYPSFRDIPRWIHRTRKMSRVPGLRTLLDAGLQGVYRSPLARIGAFASRPKLRSVLRYGDAYAGAYLLRRGVYMPEELEGDELLAEGLRRLQPERHVERLLQPEPSTSFGKVATLEAAYYMRNQLLRDTDWASMAHSLEVRVPLVDTVLLKQLAPLLVTGDKNGKVLLGRAPTRPLPDAVLNKPKTGFSTPIAKWLQRSKLWREQRSHLVSRQEEGSWARIWAWWVAAETGA